MRWQKQKQYQRMICGCLSGEIDACFWIPGDSYWQFIQNHPCNDKFRTQLQPNLKELLSVSSVEWRKPRGIMSCHLTFQSHHNFHHSTAKTCFCEVTPGHSLEQMRSQPCEHLIHQCTKRIPPEASNPALQKMSMIRSKSVHVFCLNFPSHCVIIL